MISARRTLQASKYFPQCQLLALHVLWGFMTCISSMQSDETAVSSTTYCWTGPYQCKLDRHALHEGCTQQGRWAVASAQCVTLLLKIVYVSLQFQGATLIMSKNSMSLYGQVFYRQRHCVLLSQESQSFLHFTQTGNVSR